ncbi:DUF1360 domain-containing protein [Ammoniphilus sp. CFH 90114]|uniref:DUF1360 domain-containing protein n=1 Tax=Ammoniphilus sp. CFH 90114 TaxID=2493665 RepID=UPI001F0C9662|nr:DUF1360 domain-containing protein [Ammoniphilus sp. CFH 90114]
MEILWNIPWLHLIVLILASFRLTYLIVYDEITTFLRRPFLEERYETDDHGHMMRNVDIKGSGLRYFIGSLISCHWCTGIWSSIAVVLLYGYVPLSFPILMMFAVAGAAALIASRV